MKNTIWESGEDLWSEKGDFNCSVLITDEKEPFFIQLSKEIHEKASDRPDVFWEVAQNNIIKLASKDPTPAHQSSVRQFLKEHKVQDSAPLVDAFSRELVIQCQKLEGEIRKTGLMYPASDEVGMRHSDWGYHYSLSIGKQPVEGSDVLTRDKDGMLWLDSIFLTFISKIGKEGKKAKEELTPIRKGKYSIFLKSGKKDMPLAFKMWVSKSNPFYPDFLRLLCDVLWLDIISPKEKKRIRLKTPAIAKKVWYESTATFLSNKNSVSETEKSIEYRSESGNLLAYADVATIDKAVLPFISEGLKNVSKLTGQKTFRWLVRTAWSNVIDEVTDARLIHTKGGFAGIAEMIGCTKKSDTQQVKKILHALDSCKVTISKNSSEIIEGRLISMGVVKTTRNGHPSEIDIIVGTMLLPHYVFELGKKDRLLLPIPELPPMIGNHKTYASQGLLQLYFIEELSNKSRELRSNGYVHIPEEKWVELATKAGLATTMIPQVIDRWNQEDGIIEADGEYYTLNQKGYKAELDFLLEQGERRETNSKRAKQTKKRKNGIKKN